MNRIAIKDFAVGDTCWLLTLNHGRNKEPEYQMVTVKSVGRKYVTLNKAWQRQYGLHQGEESCYLTEKENYIGTSSMLFKTREDAEEYVEVDKLAIELSNISPYVYKQCTLDQLLRIKKILGEK